MKISAEEIKKIALLSRLEVKEDQMETVGKQLNDILSYMDLFEPSRCDRCQADGPCRIHVQRHARRRSPAVAGQ